VLCNSRYMPISIYVARPHSKNEKGQTDFLLN
jgi:hypothetical protein